MNTAAFATPDSIPQAIADRFAELPQVLAVAWAGSRKATTPDEHSDFDLYIYTSALIPVADRRAVASHFADEADMELDNQIWELGDEWPVRNTPWSADLMYRSPGWIEDQLDRLIVRHEASVGYSTCFWFNVQTSSALYARDGWYTALQAKSRQPYPEELRRAIVAKNHPPLRGLHQGSYLKQLKSAVRRGDQVSIQHRSAATLASYFDILFAVNRALHPGEKRLLRYAAQLPVRPANVEQDVADFLASACAPDTIVDAANKLLDGLDEVLRAEHLPPFSDTAQV